MVRLRKISSRLIRIGRIASSPKPPPTIASASARRTAAPCSLSSSKLEEPSRASARFTRTPPRLLEVNVADTIGVVDSVLPAVKSSAHGQAHPPGVSGDLDGLVRVLTERVDGLSRTLGDLDQRVSAEQSARMQVGEELQEAIEAGDKAQEELTHDTAGDGLRKELVGVGLVLLGIVLQGIEAVAQP